MEITLVLHAKDDTLQVNTGLCHICAQQVIVLGQELNGAINTSNFVERFLNGCDPLCLRGRT